MKVNKIINIFSKSKKEIFKNREPFVKEGHGKRNKQFTFMERLSSVYNEMKSDVKSVMVNSEDFREGNTPLVRIKVFIRKDVEDGSKR